MTDQGKRRLRSQDWWDDYSEPDMTALYLERYLNYGLTREELQSGRPIIGIAQTGSDLAPCNRHHLQLASRVRDGIRDMGGIPIEFPVHPIQETGKRPTAMLDRNLQYLSLVEVLYGYPIDGVVLTTGCDKTTPALLMGAASVDIPAIVLSGGPMLNGYYGGKFAGSGTVVWHARRMLAAGEISVDQFMDMTCASAPSVGHCNTMGTASSMNAMAEALGMSLTGCAAIPGPYRERGQMAYLTGKRIVEMVWEDLRPSHILTRKAFENAIFAAAAAGASTNCPPHVTAIARHMGVELDVNDWEMGYDIPLLVNMQPAGEYLGEEFHRAGGVPAVIKELLKAGRFHGDALTVTGKTMAENHENVPFSPDRRVIRPYEDPLLPEAGFVIISGNIFNSAVMKTSVITDEFRQRYLEDPDHPGEFEGRAIVFEGPEDYHERLDDPALDIDEDCFLFIRNCGPVGYPGAAEVVNMRPPTKLIEKGVKALPTIGDGRQSGTSESPSILNASPEAAIGGNLAILRTGDRVRLDLPNRKLNVMISAEEITQRQAEVKRNPPKLPPSQTPWQEIYRSMVGQLSTGACLEPAVLHLKIVENLRQPTAQPLKLAVILALALLAGPALGEDVATDWQRISEQGVASANAGDLAGAEREFRAALALAEELPEGDPRRATTANNLGFVLHAQGRIREALPYYTDALAIRDATLGPTHPATAQSLNNLAEALRGEGQRDEAERLHRRAIDIRRTRLPPEHPDLAESLNNLGVLLTEARRFAEAKALFDEALAIRVKALGEHHAAVAEVQGNLGALAYAQGDLATAEARYGEVVVSEQASRDPNDPEIAIALSNLAQILLATGRAQQAAAPLERALAIRTTSLGPDRLETAQSRQALALALAAAGDDARAEPLLREALATRERLLDANSPELAPNLADLADLLQRKGEYDAALPLLERALAIEQANYGPDDARLAVTLNNLAALQTDRGAWRAADPLLARAAAIEEAAYGPDGAALITTLANRASVLDRLDRREEAEALRQRATAIRVANQTKPEAEAGN